MSKKCTKCETTKSLDEFNKAASNKDGLQYWCKGCARAYQQANRDRLNAASARWYEKNKEHRSEYARQWYLNRKAGVEGK